jgi:DNA replication protein DnaC
MRSSTVCLCPYGESVSAELSTSMPLPPQNLHRASGLGTCATARSSAKWKQGSLMKVSSEVCPVCGGTGWKFAGEERRVSRCDCRLKQKGEALLASARIPKRYEHCELSNFEFEGPHRNLASARMAACKFVEEYPLENTGLLLIGSIGVGKTHLAVGIIKELILSKGIGCLFYDYRELLKQIQNSYNDSVKATELDVLRPVFETEVLVLDELGAVKPTEWVWDTVSLILNTRYNDNRTTIITTNYPDDAAREASGSSDFSRAQRAARGETLGDRIGERMRSRLHEMCRIIKMEGADFRQTIKSASFR